MGGGQKQNRKRGGRKHKKKQEINIQQQFEYNAMVNQLREHYEWRLPKRVPKKQLENLGFNNMIQYWEHIKKEGITPKIMKVAIQTPSVQKELRKMFSYVNPVKNYLELTGMTEEGLYLKLFKSSFLTDHDHYARAMEGSYLPTHGGLDVELKEMVSEKRYSLGKRSNGKGGGKEKLVFQSAGGSMREIYYNHLIEIEDIARQFHEIHEEQKKRGRSYKINV